MSDSQLYIGLLSGTSVDGIDCALVDLNTDKPQLVAAKTFAIHADLRQLVLALCSDRIHSLVDLGRVNIALGREFGAAVNSLLDQAGIQGSDIIAIGSHGQTIRHEPEGEFPFSMQIGDPNTIAEMTGITTVADLRGRDVAAGGQGAPLAPLLHRVVFASSSVNRAIINIGGISNLTWLPAAGTVQAFDIGPGNVLMDHWIYRNRQSEYDSNGQWANSGQVDKALLDTLLTDDYFALSPPKSTGRERFNGPWLESKLSCLDREVQPENVQATLLQLTATTIARELNTRFTPSEAYICGGGVHNGALLHALQQAAANCSVCSTRSLGIDPDWVEAMAFAWMAKAAMENSSVDSRPFTGANRRVRLGGIYPAYSRSSAG